MTPPTILTAIRLGESALDKEHAALKVLWRKFGREVRYERKRLGISLRELAEHLGRTSAMVSMMETGVRQWPTELAEKAVKRLSK